MSQNKVKHLTGTLVAVLLLLSGAGVMALPVKLQKR
jgi:hypothetical protein